MGYLDGEDVLAQLTELFQGGVLLLGQLVLLLFTCFSKFPVAVAVLHGFALGRLPRCRAGFRSHRRGSCGVGFSFGLPT